MTPGTDGAHSLVKKLLKAGWIGRSATHDQAPSQSVDQIQWTPEGQWRLAALLLVFRELEAKVGALSNEEVALLKQFATSPSFAPLAQVPAEEEREARCR